MVRWPLERVSFVQIDIEIRQDARCCPVRFIGPFEITAFGDGLRGADLSTLGQREIHPIRAVAVTPNLHAEIFRTFEDAVACATRP